MMKGEKLVVGDRVEWTSQASGHQKTKTGTVLSVIPAGYSPTGFMEFGIWSKYESCLGYGDPRDHESYLIVGPTREGRKKQQLYFPLVRKLKKIEKVEEISLTDPTPMPEGGFCV
jgi:hypothetical protein